MFEISPGFRYQSGYEILDYDGASCLAIVSKKGEIESWLEYNITFPSAGRYIIKEIQEEFSKEEWQFEEPKITTKTS